MGNAAGGTPAALFLGQIFSIMAAKTLFFARGSENTLDILLVLVLRLWTLLDWRRGRRSVHAGQAAGDKKRVTV